MAAMHTRLDVVVRFSTSQPDIILTIENPGAMTGLSLKQRIRAELPPPANASRLRLISAGKVLPDQASLLKSLNVTAPPPPRDHENKSEKAKGKQPVRDVRPPLARVYVHCSIGDALPTAELAIEAKQAQEAEATLQTSQLPAAGSVPATGEAASTTTPAPRGFDRLLTAGFTPAEVATLRTQFLAIQAHTHTPDTMPSGAQLLDLEERWLDNTSSPSNDTQDAGGFGGEDSGGLEDMLWGNLIGFFWPIGAMCWAMREEGVWTRRRQIAVLSGFLVNLTFGFLRYMN